VTRKCLLRLGTNTYLVFSFTKDESYSTTVSSFKWIETRRPKLYANQSHRSTVYDEWNWDWTFRSTNWLDYFRQNHANTNAHDIHTMSCSTQTIEKSKQTALNRFHFLQRKFQKKPELYEQYSKVTEEYFELREITEPITKPSSPGRQRRLNQLYCKYITTSCSSEGGQQHHKTSSPVPHLNGDMCPSEIAPQWSSRGLHPYQLAVYGL